MRKSTLLIVASLIVGAGLGVYSHAAYVAAHIPPGPPEPLYLGYVTMHPDAWHTPDEQSPDLRAKLTRLDMVDSERKMIETSREGYGDIDDHGHKQYWIGELTWAKTMFPSDSPLQRGLDRDIAYCKHRLR
jgi:hypothetical protein